MPSLRFNPHDSIIVTEAKLWGSLVNIPKISVLGETIENVGALIKDLPPEAGVDGLLGLSFIKHFQVHIDFQQGKLTLERSRPRR